jgi:RNA polymerase sigma-70 factor (ECF subfamily)
MKQKQLNDQELLKNFLSGNKDALSPLLERNRRRVFDYINMIVKDRDVADDILQDTFVKVMRFLAEGRYVDNGRFLSWILRIAHNQVIDHFRRLKQQNHLTESDAGYNVMNNIRFSEPTVEDMLVREQIEQDVRKMIDFLPDEQKQVVMMRYYTGLSFKEIAEQTGVSINTCLGRMRYALMNLRKMVDEKHMVLC